MGVVGATCQTAALSTPSSKHQRDLENLCQGALKLFKTRYVGFSLHLSQICIYNWESSTSLCVGVLRYVCVCVWYTYSVGLCCWTFLSVLTHLHSTRVCACVCVQVTSTRSTWGSCTTPSLWPDNQTGRSAVGGYHHGRVLIKSPAWCTTAKIIMGILQLETW